MTKEEAIENIKLMRLNAALTNANSFKEALDMAIEALSQPAIPSNLDEAAEKYSENILANNEDLQDAIEDAFKEGAKWMVEHGETEVELEKEIERIVKDEERFMKFQVKEQLIKYVARHFAEWGATNLNKKEHAK